MKISVIISGTSGVQAGLGHPVQLHSITITRRFGFNPRIGLRGSHGALYRFGRIYSLGGLCSGTG